MQAWIQNQADTLFARGPIKHNQAAAIFGQALVILFRNEFIIACVVDAPARAWTR